MFGINRPRGTRTPPGYPYSVRTVAISELVEVSRLKTQSIPSLRDALTRYLKTVLEQPIRQVVAYQEHTENYGGCSTCEHIEVVFDVYFKNSSGRLLIYRYNGNFSELIRRLTDQDPISTH